MELYEENPFCTRRIRPGAIPYYFPQGKSVETLVDKLEANGWDGQIVGPHGSGKSTLLAAMLPEIARRGKRLVHLELQDGVRELPLLLEEYELMDENTLLAIDGYEQLSYWARRRIRNRGRQQKFGTLILAHISYGYPNLYRTVSELRTAKRLVTRLLKNTVVYISDEMVEQQYHLCKGNIREMLFSLYDVYECAYRNAKMKAGMTGGELTLPRG